MSLQGKNRLWIKAAVLLAAAAFVFALPAAGQYPGQVAKPDANAPDMRAVGVYEWTGDEAHPKAGRMVPICIYDGQDLNDAGVYLAQPEPLALQSEVEYQLQRDGQPVGLFDVNSAGELQGSWFGFGKWKPLPKSKSAPAQVAKVDENDDAQSDVPILHRKHHADDPAGGAGSGSGSGSAQVRVGLERAGSRSRSSDAAQGRRLVDFGLRPARAATVPARTGAEVPARLRPIPTGRYFTPAATAHRRGGSGGSTSPTTPAARSSRRTNRTTKPMFRTLPARAIRTVRI